jgi:ABC-type branched-subunit amino acid transport system substrate-binding protein
MMKHSNPRRLTTLLVTSTVAVAMAGCSSKAQTGASEATVPGITDDTITLGVIADLTGPFASTGVPTVEGAKLYWSNHTVCDRNVELVVKDTAYKTDRAKAAYAEMHDDIFAIQATTATPITVVNMDDFAKDSMTVVSVAAPDLAGNDNILLAGTLNDVEMMNGMSFAVSKLGIAEGSPIGAIYLNNDFGKASLVGIEKAAEHAGLSVVAQPAEVTDQDMTAQITALKGAGVKAIFVAGSAGVLNSAVTVAKAQGLDVPFVASAGAFDASALSSGAKSGLVENTYFVAYVAPYGDAAAGPTENRTANEKAGNAARPSHWMNLGYGMAAIMDKALSDTCSAGDLTRDNLLATAKKLGQVDTQGAMVPLTFGQRSPGMSSFVLRPDESAPDGLTIFAEPFEGDITKALATQ